MARARIFAKRDIARFTIEAECRLRATSDESKNLLVSDESISRKLAHLENSGTLICVENAANGKKQQISRFVSFRDLYEIVRAVVNLCQI